jgi:nucleoside-diphosphate-sugar epimerase
MKRSAIIGHTGLVGSNLVRQAQFDACYNSSNIQDIAGRCYDLLVCSGARGTKWVANQDPAADIAGIEILLDNLRRVRAERVILISTVDVFGHAVGVDEDAPVDPVTQSPYGRHRHYVERVVLDHFPRVLIVRLPGLFGRGLRKNALYDLLCGHEVEKIHPASAYQFYWLEHAWRDIQQAVGAGLELVHFATEPIRIADVARNLFGMELAEGPAGVTPAAYDFKTKHAALFNGADGYMKDRPTVMDEIRTFAEWFRQQQGAPA